MIEDPLAPRGVVAQAVGDGHEVHGQREVVAVHRAVRFAPIHVPALLGVPETTLRDGLVEAGLQLFGVALVSRRARPVAYQTFDLRPQHERAIHLGVDERVLVAGPDHVQPVAGLVLGARAIGHFDQPVSVGVALQEVLQRRLAGRLLPGHPFQISREVELLGDVDDVGRLRVHQPAPLALVEPQRVVGAGRGVAGEVGPARLDHAVPGDGVIALVVERAGHVRRVLRVAHSQAHQREPRLVEHRVAAVPPVAAHDLVVDHADAPDGVQDLAHGRAVDAPQVAPVVGGAVTQAPQGVGDAGRLTRSHLEGRPHVLPTPVEVVLPVLGQELLGCGFEREREHVVRLAREPKRHSLAAPDLRADVEARIGVPVPQRGRARVHSVSRVRRVEQLAPRHPARTKQRAGPRGHRAEVPARGADVLQGAAG